jgi:hypothetical protein
MQVLISTNTCVGHTIQNKQISIKDASLEEITNSFHTFAAGSGAVISH